MSWLIAVAVLAQAPADAGADTGESDLLNAIDQAAGTPLPTDAGVPPPVAPTNPFVRAFQSLNPDVSVIVEGNAGYMTRAPYSLAGDDPVLTGNPGFALQEIEVAFQAVVDPYFRADLFLTIPNLTGLEVEEAMLTTTGLPAGLQVKAGMFRSAFGRQNGQHLHIQDFTRRPLLNEAYLGTDGLRAPGLQASWLIPVPFFLQLNFEMFKVLEPGHSFGADRPTDFTYTSELKFFAPATESLSIYGGLNFATGKAEGFSATTLGATSVLEGADLYVKYKPPNVTGGYFSVAWTTEYILRQIYGTGPLETPTVDGGLYTQLVLQVARRWFLGLREDILGVPYSPAQPRVLRTGAEVTFIFSEFARLRVYGESEHPFAQTTRWAAYLQLEAAIGAHGAHPF
jgi:hypothetical protein